MQEKEKAPALGDRGLTTASRAICRRRCGCSCYITITGEQRDRRRAKRVDSSKADADDATLIERVDCATAHTSVP